MGPCIESNSSFLETLSHLFTTHMCLILLVIPIDFCLLHQLLGTRYASVQWLIFTFLFHWTVKWIFDKIINVYILVFLRSIEKSLPINSAHLFRKSRCFQRLTQSKIFHIMHTIPSRVLPYRLLDSELCFFISRCAPIIMANRIMFRFHVIFQVTFMSRLLTGLELLVKSYMSIESKALLTCRLRSSNHFQILLCRGNSIIECLTVEFFRINHRIILVIHIMRLIVTCNLSS